MGNIKVTQQTQVIVNQTTVIEQQTPRPVPPPQPVSPPPTPEPLFEQDNFTPSTPDSPVGVIKKTAGGALVGGSASALAGIVGHAMMEESFKAPSLTTVGLGVALGAGIGLVNLDTGDDEVNAGTKALGGTLMGAGIGGIAQSIGKSIFTENAMGPSTSGVLLSAALGGGIALVNTDSGNDAIDNGAKAVGGLMIGAGATGLAQGFAKTVFTEYLHGASTPGVLMGAALGGGIALANIDTGDKTMNTVKNTAAGALIGGGAVGLASAFVKTIGAERLMGYSPVAMGIGAALGAGIAILNAEE